ncbi:uncharacterized protein BYT42DRAFT_559910 [Radiomyces spectabilis]|uniref:uncharacterized protein n=1 Tax=Radiomyces spectabilis TaxID=64574 RepID=UPI002220EC18|nr:uncharacterized protein BYT42DRAFT_559910 [Radiomyces spectabilis]KAI8388387.1 hypothetical protein BYT42DRAFT_559910 [Radiomyces spectabilis]
MGCCGSKEERNEDDVNAPLLSEPSNGENRMNYQTYEIIDVQKEQEFWNNVIERTTRNLIDISSSQADPLQRADIQERVDKYRDLLDQITEPVNTKPSKQQQQQQQQQLIRPVEHASPFELLSNAKPNGGLSEDELDSLYQTMNEIYDTLQCIKVEPVGNMVVNLTLNDNSVRAS